MYESYGRIGKAGRDFRQRLFNHAKAMDKRDADGTYSTWLGKKRVQIASVLARTQARLVRERIRGLEVQSEMGRQVNP